MKPTQFFDVGNKSRIGLWCLANDAEDAAQIALKKGHVKNAKHARVHGPQDMSKDTGYESLKKFMERGERGRVIKKGISLTMDEILKGKKSPPPEWLIDPA